MTAARSRPLSWLAAPLVWLALTAAAPAEPQLDTIRDVVLAIHRCWRPPPPDKAGPIDITVIVSFNRTGVSLGGAVAGRPFAIPFRNKKYPPKSQEKRAWLLPKIL